MNESMVRALTENLSKALLFHENSNLKIYRYYIFKATAVEYIEIHSNIEEIRKVPSVYAES